MNFYNPLDSAFLAAEINLEHRFREMHNDRSNHEIVLKLLQIKIMVKHQTELLKLTVFAETAIQSTFTYVYIYTHIKFGDIFSLENALDCGCILSVQCLKQVVQRAQNTLCTTLVITFLYLKHIPTVFMDFRAHKHIANAYMDNIYERISMY